MYLVLFRVIRGIITVLLINSCFLMNVFFVFITDVTAINSIKFLYHYYHSLRANLEKCVNSSSKFIPYMFKHIPCVHCGEEKVLRRHVEDN